MRLLLHICCASCLLYPLEVLRGKGFEVEGVFYNPNIHPWQEYNKRKEALEKFCELNSLTLEVPAYAPEEFFRQVNFNEQLPQRCQRCFSLRMNAVARLAKDKGFDGFSTTLLVSPYQDHQVLKLACEDAARQEGIVFYYEDFRVGFRSAHQKARQLGIYCQNYCGCIYSEIERFKKKNKYARVS